eukprot:GSMAST32.ASY1.ANO1.1830.1 assembled CDS
MSNFSFTTLFGDKLIGKDGEVNTEDVTTGKVVGVYFSAHWCPPCRGFTPVLGEKYSKLKAAGKEVEIVFASSDQDEKTFKSYHDTMPFLALPFGKRDLKNKLSKKFSVSGIPTLVFLDADGKTITTEGRGNISSDSFIDDFPYHPKPLNDIKDCVSGLNDKRSLVVIMDKASESVQKKISEALLTVATSELEVDENERKSAQYFFTAKGGGCLPQLRSRTGLPEQENPIMILLDLDDDGSFYTFEGEGGVNLETIKAFMNDFKEKKLKKQQFKR